MIFSYIFILVRNYKYTRQFIIIASIPISNTFYLGLSMIRNKYNIYFVDNIHNLYYPIFMPIT